MRLKNVLALATLISAAALGSHGALAEDLAPRSLAEELQRSKPLTPDEAARSFLTQDGFRLELLAAEPLVTDPVAIAYDENGRAYVAEMGDYPYSDKSFDKAWEEQKSAPLGRIRLLEDTDGDGRFDRSRIFADGLSWPTGVAVWKQGVFVTATPDILYLKDLDGDGVVSGAADERRVVFRGFRKFNVQAVINNPMWGLDGRLYVAGSSNGGAIAKGESGPVVATLGQNDFCFDPVTEELEVLAGGARFGNSFDDFGRRFICNIRNPVQHVVLDNRYLKQAGAATIRSALHDAADAGEVQVFRASPPEPWRVLSAERHSANPDNPTPKSEKAATGYVTSSAGVTIYRGSAYPEEFLGNAFVGEVAGNVILRYRLAPSGPTFRAERVADSAEFVASTDTWFRPVNFVNAPDGTLHVLDMVRETIEHPWSIPDDIKEHLDLRSGTDRGRIWRLVPGAWREGYQPPAPPRLGEASSEELVAALESENGWHRETALRLIHERQDGACEAPLRRLLAASSSASARLHAFYALHGLKRLSARDALAAMSDAAPEVREHAILLAERFSLAGELRERVIELAEDDHARVRMQAALTLGAFPGDGSSQAFSAIARRDAGDPWMRAALLCSLGDAAADFLSESLANKVFLETPGGSELLSAAAMSLAANSPDDAAAIFEQIAQRGDGEATRQIVFALGSGLSRKGIGLGDWARRVDSSAGRFVLDLLAASARDAASPEFSEERRAACLRLAAMGGFEFSQALLLDHLQADRPPALRAAAIELLAAFSDERVGELLLAHYDSLTPPLKRPVVLALLSRPDRHLALLNAIAEKRISPSMLSLAQRQVLERSAAPEVSELAAKVFAESGTASRQAAIERYKPALALAADRARGAAIFKRECANCHRLGGQGHAVGPDLATIRHRTAAEVLGQILDPNKEVSPHFLEYAATTKDGRIVTGVIVAETAAAITLRGPESKEQIVPREEIETLSGSGKSLMPEGLEEKITPQEMADLLSILVGS